MQGVLLAYLAKRLIHTSAAVLNSFTRAETGKHVIDVCAFKLQPVSGRTATQLHRHTHPRLCKDRKQKYHAEEHKRLTEAKLAYGMSGWKSEKYDNTSAEAG